MLRILQIQAVDHANCSHLRVACLLSNVWSNQRVMSTRKQNASSCGLPRSSVKVNYCSVSVVSPLGRHLCFPGKLIQIFHKGHLSSVWSPCQECLQHRILQWERAWETVSKGLGRNRGWHWAWSKQNMASGPGHWEHSCSFPAWRHRESRGVC